jgi:protein ImuB
VETGEEEALLASLPLAALRIDASVRAGLESVGLRTAGAVMDAPRAPLARRFGRLLMLRLDQALGRVEEAISPRLPAPSLSVERRLAEPVVTTEAIERLVGLLAATLRSDLERRGDGARALQLALFRVDGAVSRIAVGTARPLRDPDRIGLLFHEKLAALEDRIDAGFGFDLIRLSVLSLARFEAEQADFSGEDVSEEERLVLFADRIRARLGDHAVLKVLPVESHLPERAAAAVPFVGRAATYEYAPTPDRPIRLFSSPEPIEAVAAEVPEGAPASFRWRRVFHRIAASEGPERIAPEWWRGDGGEETRDYFRVEDEEGRRFWLYRQGLYGDAPQGLCWFMHGIFA